MVPTNFQTPSPRPVSSPRTPRLGAQPRSPWTSPNTISSGPSLGSALDNAPNPPQRGFAPFDFGSPASPQNSVSTGLGSPIQLTSEGRSFAGMLFGTAAARVSSANVGAAQDVFGPVRNVPRTQRGPQQQLAPPVGLGITVQGPTARPLPAGDEAPGAAAPRRPSFGLQRAFLSRQALPPHPTAQELSRCYAEPDGDAYSDIEDEHERNRAFDRTNPSPYRPASMGELHTQSSPKISFYR